MALSQELINGQKELNRRRELTGFRVPRSVQKRNDQGRGSYDLRAALAAPARPGGQVNDQGHTTTPKPTTKTETFSSLPTTAAAAPQPPAEKVYKISEVRPTGRKRCAFCGMLAEPYETRCHGGHKLETLPAALTEPLPDTVTVYPTILTAMLEQNLAPVGRFYLLMKALDAEGRGVLPVDEVRQRFTKQLARYRVCG